MLLRRRRRGRRWHMKRRRRGRERRTSVWRRERVRRSAGGRSDGCCREAQWKKQRGPPSCRLTSTSLEEASRVRSPGHRVKEAEDALAAAPGGGVVEEEGRRDRRQAQIEGAPSPAECRRWRGWQGARAPPPRRRERRKAVVAMAATTETARMARRRWG